MSRIRFCSAIGLAVLLILASAPGRAQTLADAPTNSPIYAGSDPKVAAYLARKDAQEAAHEAPFGLTNEQARVSYAIGVIFGSGLRRDNFDVDLTTILRGLLDTMQNTNGIMTEKRARHVLAEYNQELQDKRDKEELALAHRNREAGKAFCATNALRDGVITLASGLQYRVLQRGHGPLVDTNQVVQTHWRGTLIDGTEFQDTSKVTFGREFRFGKDLYGRDYAVIKGLAQALPMMHVGDRWEIVLPTDLAYGDGTYLGGKTPPGSTLIYDLEVLEQHPPAPPTVSTANAGGKDSAASKTN